ncbi:hypothetical protein VNO77_14778 [Canavalia gladiata]|uniref:Uncharacterized protein n=1 Tax=Canavalia gladiata TaxID=3824 RepID=A0AAN9LYZ9_CANGL
MAMLRFESAPRLNKDGVKILWSLMDDADELIINVLPRRAVRRDDPFLSASRAIGAEAGAHHGLDGERQMRLDSAAWTCRSISSPTLRFRYSISTLKWRRTCRCRLCLDGAVSPPQPTTMGSGEAQTTSHGTPFALTNRQRRCHLEEERCIWRWRTDEGGDGYLGPRVRSAPRASNGHNQENSS